MVSPTVALMFLNTLLGFKNMISNNNQDSAISDLRNDMAKRGSLLSKDIRNLVDEQLGSGKSAEMNAKLEDLVNLKGDLIDLINQNKSIQEANQVVEVINDAIDPFIAYTLTQLNNFGVTLGKALESDFKLTSIIVDLTEDQELKWTQFVNTVSAVVENLEMKVNDLERLITINQSYQAELSFQMLALKTETTVRLADLQNYIRLKEDELAVQLRVLGSLQDNATVVLTESDELVYSNEVTYKSSTPVVAGTLTQQTVDNFQSVRVTGVNVRQANLVGDGNSFSVNEDTFIDLNVDYNGEVLYVAIRTQGNNILDLLSMSTITTIRNTTQIIDTSSLHERKGTGPGTGWGGIRYRNVTTAVREPSDSHNFHFGLIDGIGILPQLVNIEVLKGSPGLSILKLSVDPGVRANFSSYMTKSKIYSRYGSNIAWSQALLDTGEVGWISSKVNAQSYIGGTYRKRADLLDFNSSLYKARLILKIPKSNIGIDGITVFRI